MDSRPLRVLVAKDISTKNPFKDCSCCNFTLTPSLEEGLSQYLRQHHDLVMLDHALIQKEPNSAYHLFDGKPVALFAFSVSPDLIKISYVRDCVTEILRDLPSNGSVGCYVHHVWADHLDRRLDKVISASRSVANALAVQI